MNEKGTVRLKVFLLLVLATFTIASPNIRDGRLEVEAEEKEWVDVDPVGPTQRSVQETSSQSSEEKEEPILYCANFDENDCEKNGTCDVTMIKCEEENHLRALGCLAVFSWNNNMEVNSTEEFVPVKRPQYKKLGCMQYQHSDSMNCIDENKCLQGHRYRSGIGMCCCTGNKCNIPELISMNNPSFQKAVETKISLDQPVDFAHNKIPTGIDWAWISELTMRYLYLTLALAAVALLVAVLIIAGCHYVRKQDKKKVYMQMSSQEQPVDVESGVSSPLLKDEILEMFRVLDDLPIEDLTSRFQMITNGRFGQVFRGTLNKENEEPRFVAVKKFDSHAEQSYRYEKAVYEELHRLPKWYPCILKMHLTREFEKESWMVLDFHERLSLYDLLKATPISITTANRFILTMVDGLQFLHDDRPYFFGHTKRAIIHRDIKSKNILVKSDMTTCIGDFGLARFYEYDIYNSDLLGQVGTKRYMSPEMLEGATEFGPTAFKSMDVYSMGLCIWEVLQRTKINKDDVVPTYAMPYEDMGYNPSIAVVRNHVSVLKLRPLFRQAILDHDYMSMLARVTTEMWDSEQCGRITSGCAFARFWTIVTKNFEMSEGYISGSSLNGGKENDEPKDGEKNTEGSGEAENADADPREDKHSDEERSTFIETRPEDMEPMIRWHRDPITRPHPTLDPFRDPCPPVPDVPVMTEQGYFYSSNVLNEHEKLFEDTGLDVGREQVFDIGLNRMLTPEEQLAFNEQQKMLNETEKDFNSRCSTPTPSASMF